MKLHRFNLDKREIYPGQHDDIRKCSDSDGYLDLEGECWKEIRRKAREKPDPLAAHRAKTYRIPDDYDPQVEVRRLKAGGCCGGRSKAD